MVTRSEALELLRQAEALEAELAKHPLLAIPWLPGQIAWLSDRGPLPKLFRTGVRGGKTVAAVQEIVGWATGDHPFRDDLPEPPVKIAVVTTDKQAQGIAIQRLFWELCPRHLLLPTTEFSNRTGFKGHVPMVEFLNGSTVTFYSANAGPKALQGSEFHYIHIDEPCSEEMFEECRNRVRNTGGQVGITLTPLNQPVPYLEALCEKGLVTDHHFRLTVENQTSPITGKVRVSKAGIPWDQTFIDQWEKELAGSPAAGIILHGDWETRHDGQYFSCFVPAEHVSSKLPKGTAFLHLGFDYAAADREHGMCAVLSAVTLVDENGSLRPHIHALDEVVMPGHASTEQFSKEVLLMLRRNGLKWVDVDHVFGDIPARAKGEISSNTEMMRWLERRLKLKPGTMQPRIQNAKEGAGASSRSRRVKDLRCRWMWQAIANGRVQVHPRCKVLREALEKWDYGDKHPLKDVLDAWMYGLRDVWTSRSETHALPRVQLG